MNRVAGRGRSSRKNRTACDQPVDPRILPYRHGKNNETTAPNPAAANYLSLSPCPANADLQ